MKKVYSYTLGEETGISAEQVRKDFSEYQIKGNIGSSLSNYSKFIQRQINIVATFDIDPSKQRLRSEIPVYTMDRMGEVIKRFSLNS